MTGATGFLGGLVAATLLREEDVHVVVPVRFGHPPDAVIEAIRMELAVRGERLDPERAARIHQVPLPEHDLKPLDRVADRLRVEEIVHCAGCLSYFDEEALRAVNIGLTQRFVEAGKRWGVRRFVHISTAFASGYVDGPIREHLHDEPGGDPTFYTESKRRGERIVAESGLPFLILRPSVVIGDSRDGHYLGPRYGLYQLWTGIARFLLGEWHREIHYVAPPVRAALLHQDAFQSGFLGAWRHLPAGSICHLTTRDGPGLRELADLFFLQHLCPKTIRYYDRLADVPLDAIPRAQRDFLRLAATNIEISSRRWDFERTSLDQLVARGVPFADATLESVGRCQAAFVRGSTALRRFTAKHRATFARDDGPRPAEALA